MSKASGVVLIMAGLGVAAYMMPFISEDADPQAEAHAITVIKDSPTRQIATATVSEEIIPPIPKPAVRPAKREAIAAVPDQTKPAVVTVAQRVKEPAADRQATRSGASILPGDRVGLTRELQKELKRVGCYEGEINGIWTPAARRAMKAFTDRVNATLPIDQPDYILLTLVQSGQDRACSAPCPAGQGMSDDDRCLPNAVLASKAKKTTVANLPSTSVKSAAVEKPATVTSSWSATATATVTATATATDASTVPEGRMALAGPSVPDSRESVGKPAHRLAAIAEAPDEVGSSRVKPARPVAQERVMPSRGVYERPSKAVAVEKPTRRYAAVSRRKLGPWFFRQQDTWNN